MTEPAHDVPLAPLTTLRLGGPARTLVTASTDTELVQAVRDADAAGEPVLLLAGGSNLVISDDGFAGTVVHVAGIEFLNPWPAYLTLKTTVDSGTAWMSMPSMSGRLGSLSGPMVFSPRTSSVTPCRMSYSVGAHSCDTARRAKERIFIIS